MLISYGFGWLPYIRIFFYMLQYFWQNTVLVYSAQVDSASTDLTVNIEWTSCVDIRGGSRRGGAHPVHALPKIGKIMIFFGVKSWFFTQNTPTIFAPPSAIGKNIVFWRKIVIFHAKYPNNFRASLCSAQIF